MSIAAKDAFLDMMTDAKKWHIETDETGTQHTIITGDRQLANLVAALGIDIRWGEPTEDAIQRSVDAGPQPDALPASKEAEAVAYRVVTNNTAMSFYLTREEAEYGAKNRLTYVKGCTSASVTPLFAHPPTDAGVSEALADAIVNFVADWAPEDDEDTMRRDLEQMFKRFAALSIPAGDGVPLAIRDIAAERKRQIEAEGWTPEHDDSHGDGEMARAAGIYAVIAGSNLTNYRNATGGYNLGTILGGLMDHYWPWAPTWFKPTDRRRDLVKAGALIIAEIERLDRLSTASTSGKG